MEHALSRACRLLAAGLGLALASGCTGMAPHMDQALRDNPMPQRSATDTASEYRVGCPDVLAVTVANNGNWQRRPVSIGVDGRIELDKAGRLRVEGQTTAETGVMIASRLGVPVGLVRVDVAEYRSEKVYLFGEAAGKERAVSFRGQETVVELLQRAGGITPAAAPNEIYVIRPHVADGKPPEVFPVKLRDILVNHDARTNVMLEPSDQVHIGEMRRSTFGRCIPPVLRPLYDGLCGMHRSGQTAAGLGPTARTGQPEAPVAAAAPLALLPRPLAAGD